MLLEKRYFPTSRTVILVFQGAALLSLWSIVLFADLISRSFPNSIGLILGDITAVVEHSEIQWIVFYSLGTYFAVCLFLRFSRLRYWRIENPCLWLAAGLLINVAAYAHNYRPSEQALIFLAGATVGQCVAIWNNAKRGNQISTIGHLMLFVLVFFLTVASVWNKEPQFFKYHGHIRWSGPLENPNDFGLLMGVGLLLTLGFGIRKWRLKNKNYSQWCFFVLSLFVIIITARALLYSFSRGAWLGTAVALGYLAWHLRNQWSASDFKHKRVFVSLTVILASLLTLVFSIYHDAEGTTIRRVFSVANANDFSWKKRIAAYEGSLQMIAGKPWFGFGWNQPESVYEQFYLARKVDEGMAIQLNDYFTLGATLGIPALASFLIYVWLKIAPVSSGISTQGSFENIDWLKITCRAAVIVLLVGFCFDGGLFKLAIATPFWILLELGSANLTPMKLRQASNNETLQVQ